MQMRRVTYFADPVPPLSSFSIPSSPVQVNPAAIAA